MTIQEVKQSFRLYMNGVAAQSMREKGLAYKLIWGVSIQHLQEMATEIGEDSALACQLWKEDIRECKILATLIMPKSEMTKELAEEWLDTLTTQEMAEWLAFNLLRHLPFAKEVAEKAVESGEKLKMNCGNNILKRLG